MHFTDDVVVQGKVTYSAVAVQHTTTLLPMLAALMHNIDRPNEYFTIFSPEELESLYQYQHRHNQVPAHTMLGFA